MGPIPVGGPFKGGSMDNERPEFADLEEDEGPAVGLVLHTFEIRGTTEDDLHIYKAITREAAQAILEEMPHIVTDEKPSN